MDEFDKTTGESTGGLHFGQIEGGSANGFGQVEGPPPIETTEPPPERSIARGGETIVGEYSMEVARSANLFGTFEVGASDSYYIFATQTRRRKTWILTQRDTFENLRDQSKIEAVLSIYNTGKMEGLGKTFLLTRMLETLNGLVGKVAQSGNVKQGFFMSGEYSDESDNSMLKFTASSGGSLYTEVSMVYSDMKLSVSRLPSSLPFAIPKSLQKVQDSKDKAAMVAGLGVRTFALLKKQRGRSLDWYDEKDYRLIQTNEEFRQMMLEFLRSVQKAYDNGEAVVAGLDTETTGLNMLKLEHNNPYRDYIVAIPFGWEKDKAYVICTEMYYFNNVDAEEIYPLFHILFRRKPDFSYQDIDLDYCGEHFHFNRQSIMVVGVNAGFDTRAFLSHDCDVFFDEDISIMHYNLATDWSQGRNGLKWMEHHYLGVETLELEDLFGKKHQDKYRYLSDPDLALVYGGADADFPRDLFTIFKRIMPANLYKLYKKYDMTILHKTARATWIGMPIDDKRVKEQGDQILKDLETLKDFIYEYAYVANKNTLASRATKLCELLGIDSVSELENETEDEVRKLYRYPFTPANHKKLLFGILGYPVVKVSEKSGEPALDKFVLKKLASKERETPVEVLTESIYAESDPSMPLVDKDKFNSQMYPLAQVFITYAKLNKEYTAYYRPIMTNDLEGRMFYPFSMQRIATRRISCAGQTMKGSLKKLVVAPPGKLFMCFDASQIEYRHMASMSYIQTKQLMQEQYPDDWEERLEQSGIAHISKMMQNPESDYHIETASMMTGLPQYQIDSATRKMYKSVGFGIPYGLGDRAMCENLFGRVTKENLVKTEEVLDDYKRRQFEIIRMLETVRDSAFMPAKIPDEFRKMLDIGETHVGIVKNFVGFYRLFILENLTRARTGRIRRQAGNCVIQGGAAELFRRMLYNFHQGCVAAGIGHKVDWLMLVHDEVDTIVDADIDVCLLIKVLYECCTLRYADHIPYYIGIGFGHNWKEAKGDGAELPVVMVDRLVKAYNEGKFSIPCDGNQAENLLKLKRHYQCDRVYEVLSKIIPGLSAGHEWTEEEANIVGDKFDNYTVRSYLSEFISRQTVEKYGKKAPLLAQLIDWQKAREQYGFGVDFLSEHFEDAQEQLRNLDISSDADVLDFGIGDDLAEMEFDLGESRRSEDQELELEYQRENSWFSEDAMSDPNSVADDDAIDGGDGYRYYKVDGNDEEDNLEVNDNPTSAFDVFVSKHYVRKCIFKSGDDTYTVMLQGTKFSNHVIELGRAVKREYGSGSGTLLLIGNEIRRASNLDLTDERLDELDKMLTD